MTRHSERTGKTPPAAVSDRRGGSRSTIKFIALLALCSLLFAGFVSLGVWQIHRRTWKLALIERANERVHAPPVAAPGPARWSSITADSDGYRHVTATGRFLNDAETYVQANTELGPGFWVLTPLRTEQGFTVLINRGFVPPDHRNPETRKDGQIAGLTRVSGLLRVSEPKGAFLRSNVPSDDRWYSRDVAAIARKRGLHDVAPYFIDADRDPSAPADAPVGGLTVIKFRNAHLQYAITWFALAALSAVGIVLLVRDRRRGPNG